MSQAFPHSVVTERQALAACAADLTLLSRYGIDDEDFWRADHRALRSWLALEAAGVPVPTTVLIERMFRARPVGVDLAEASDWLISEAPMPGYIAGIIEQLRSDRVRRSAMAAIDTAREALSLATGSAADVIGDLASLLRTEAARLTPGSLGVDLKDAIGGLADTLADRLAGRAPASTSTGSDNLDAMIGGLHPGDLVVVAASPGVGKTSISLSWCGTTARSGLAAAFFSVEMLTEQLAARIVSEALGLPGGELRGVPSAALVETVRELADRLDVPVRLWCGRYSMGTIAEQARGYAYECKRRGQRLGLVVVDYLQILDLGSDRKASLSERTGEAAYQAKDLALELGCTVVAVSQLSRAASHRDDKRPMLTDLRNSGDIEAAADVVLGLYRDEVYNPETEDVGLVEVIPLKSRHVELTVADTVPLRRAQGGGAVDYSEAFVREWRRQRAGKR
jgi:replicative DNA helicase